MEYSYEGGEAIKNPQILCSMCNPLVIITPLKNNSDIVNQLIDMGVYNIYQYTKENRVERVFYKSALYEGIKKHEISVGKFLEVIAETDSIKLDNVCFRSGGIRNIRLCVSKRNHAIF